MRMYVAKKAYSLLLREMLTGDKPYLPRVYVCGNSVFIYKAAALRHVVCTNLHRDKWHHVKMELVTINDAYEAMYSEVMSNEFAKKVDWNFQSQGTLYPGCKLFNPMLCEDWHRDLRYDAVCERISSTPKD